MLWWFLHTFTGISHGRTCVPWSRTPSHFPPHPSLWGCPSAPALSALFHALNLDWSSISHMVIYMFQCYSLKSSHPHLLPQSPKICSLYLCLICCLIYRVVVTIFLNSRLLSRFSCVQLCATPQTAAHQAPLSLGFSRQEYWSGLPFHSPMHACILSRFSSVQCCATLWTAAHQAPLSMGFSRQEYICINILYWCFSF